MLTIVEYVMAMRDFEHGLKRHCLRDQLIWNMRDRQARRWKRVLNRFNKQNKILQNLEWIDGRKR